MYEQHPFTTNLPAEALQTVDINTPRSTSLFYFVHITIYAVKYNSPIGHSQFFFCYQNELFLVVSSY